MNPAPSHPTASANPPSQPRPIRFVTNHEGPYAKRRRINSACLTCRRKKTRCSGETHGMHVCILADEHQANALSVGPVRRTNTNVPAMATTTARPTPPRTGRGLPVETAPPRLSRSSTKPPPSPRARTCHTLLQTTRTSRPSVACVAQMKTPVCLLGLLFWIG